MLFCKNCGQQLEEDSKFCKNCGTKLIENKEENILYGSVVNNKANNFSFCNFLLNFIKRHWFGISLTVELIILFVCLYNIIQGLGYVAWIILGCLAFLLFMGLIIFIGSSEDRKK